ncbi:hypothetical protein PENTCL1PPCAC_12543, partial [Pristionchus entomophagus]
SSSSSSTSSSSPSSSSSSSSVTSSSLSDLSTRYLDSNSMAFSFLFTKKITSMSVSHLHTPHNTLIPIR